MNSESMNEILKIKEELSKEYSNMTLEEIKEKEKKSLDWFYNTKNKGENNYPTNQEPSYVSQDTEEYTS